MILDLLTVKFLSSYLTRPIPVLAFLGLSSTMAGAALLGHLGIERLFLASFSPRPLVLLGILLTVVGVQFIAMELFAEMIARTYHESQGKPVYIVREVLDSIAGASLPIQSTEKVLLLDGYEKEEAQELR